MSDNPSLATLSLTYGHEPAVRMLEARTMQRIKAAVGASADPVPDLHVFHRREVRAVNALCAGVQRRLFLDVPLRAIVALSHKNFAPDAHSWRALLDGVHGVGWEQSAIDWMESAIGISEFPADDALGSLRFQAAGGALRCSHGTHRLVAAVCWLAVKKGDEATRSGSEAVLRKVDAGCTTSIRKRWNSLSGWSIAARASISPSTGPGPIFAWSIAARHASSISTACD
ncbi:hypothetical protein P3T40_006811 [Paraburkholderia sp. EB58]|uniref:hypothetical protein n=1 Tax=Paraburkholderia sp. EB58 TaxID=3035125 RepID=UPI003D1F5743